MTLQLLWTGVSLISSVRFVHPVNWCIKKLSTNFKCRIFNHHSDNLLFGRWGFWEISPTTLIHNLVLSTGPRRSCAINVIGYQETKNELITATTLVFWPPYAVLRNFWIHHFMVALISMVNITSNTTRNDLNLIIVMLNTGSSVPYKQYIFT